MLGRLQTRSVGVSMVPRRKRGGNGSKRGCVQRENYPFYP